MTGGGDLLAVSPAVQFRSEKLAGWAGILGVAAGTLGGVVIAPVWRFPATTSTSRQIATYVLSHRTEMLVGMLLNTAGVTLWLVFAAGVWTHLRRLGADDVRSACFALGMVAAITLLLTGFVAFFVLAYRAPAVLDARLLYDLTFGALAMSGAPTAVALGAYATLSFRNAVLAPATAWLAIVAAVAHLALPATFIPSSGFLSLEGQVITAVPATLFVWIAYTATAMLRRSEG